MSTIDLDAIKRARLEARKDEPLPVLKFGGREFTLPREAPATYSIALAEGDWRGAMNGLLLAGAKAKAEGNGGKPPDQVTAFWALDPSTDDLLALADEVGKALGGGAGE